jgi:hypothetical protein
MVRKFKEIGHILRCAVSVAGVRQLDVRVSELIEEWVNHGFNGGKALSRRVLKQFRDQVDRVRISLPKDLRFVSLRCLLFRAEGLSYLVEWMGLDLREFVLHVVRVHGADLITRGRSEHFDDFHELVDTGFSGEKRLTEHQLCHDATSRPHICNMSAAVQLFSFMSTYQSWWCSSSRRR